MEEPNSPYVWRGDAEESSNDRRDGSQETVIVDGEAMSYRRYQRGNDPDLTDY